MQNAKPTSISVRAEVAGEASVYCPYTHTMAQQEPTKRAAGCSSLVLRTLLCTDTALCAGIV